MRFSQAPNADHKVRRACIGLGGLLVVVLLGSCVGRAADKRPQRDARSKTEKLYTSSDVVLQIGDRTRVGPFLFTVEATQATTGAIFGLPAGRKPPRGKEWFVADVLIESKAAEPTDLESFAFRLNRGERSIEQDAVSKVIMTDRTTGLESPGILRPGGRLAMSVAFSTQATDRRLLLTFHVVGTTSDATFLVR